MDMANDVRLAARRFGFRRQSNLHPAEAIEDPGIAHAGIASAFIELDDLPTAAQRNAMARALQAELGMTADAADELAILGRWMAAECGGPDAAISRLSRKLARLSGQEAFAPLLAILKGTAQATGDGLSTRQSEALADIQRAFRVR